MRGITGLVAALAGALGLIGCAPTQVQSTYQREGPMPRPQRVAGAPMNWGNALLIEGQFLSIDEGNRTERTVIGLGMGRSDVEALVQVYQARATQLVRLEEFSTSAKSGYKPGAAETMGMGAAAGTLAVSAAVTVGGTIASEALGANVEADARRTAASVADQLESYFAEQRWIQPQ
jgi:hypothetical protein